MTNRRVASNWFCSVILVLVGAACAAGAAPYERKVVGGVEVKDEVGGLLPEREPRTIYVADFALNAESYSGDEGVRGALPRKLGQRLRIRWRKIIPRRERGRSSKLWPSRWCKLCARKV